MATFADPNVRPALPPPDFAGIPEELRLLPQWVVWKFDWVERGKGAGEWSKVPFNPETGFHARSNDSTTWGTFDIAVTACRSKAFDGIGFMFSPDDPYCGVDLDNCVDADGELSAVAYEWVTMFSSYTEMSPSSTGVHIIVKARVEKGRKDKTTGIEIYNAGRYFTFTGRSWHENVLPIKDSQWLVNELLATVFPEQLEPEKRAMPGQVYGTAGELLEIAFRAKNGSKIKSLFDGDVSAHADDDSSADMALCNHLAFYSGGDPGLLDSMFRASRLMRPKWDKQHHGDGRTYGEGTIDEALRSCAEFYSPNGNKPAATEEAKPSEGIKTVEDYAGDLDELYQTGFVPGVHPGWSNLASLYTVKPGQWTVVTGSPGSGKSVWLNALLVNLAVRYDWNFVLCSPEFWPVSVHIAELMSLYAGEPFTPGPTPKMGLSTAKESAAWVGEHFTFIDPGPDQSLTLDYVLDVTGEVAAKKKIHGLVLDPWTEFEQDRLAGETETDFTKRKLTQFGRFVRHANIHAWIVAHPKMMKRDASGNFPIPTPYDISGSAHWYNKPIMALSLHRPDQNSQRAQVHVQKVKFRWCGNLGFAELFYDKVTGRYFEKRADYSQAGDERW